MTHDALDDAKISVGKYPSQASLCVQAADLADDHQTEKALLPGITAMSDQEKADKEKIFGQLKASRVNLPKSQFKAIADYLATLPRLTATIDVKDSTKNGFARAGQGPDGPDLKGLLSVGNRTLTKAEMSTSIKSLPALIKHLVANGSIPDSVYNELGFTPDKHPTTGKVSCVDDGAPLREQRAILVTHEATRQLTIRKITGLNDKAQSKTVPNNLKSSPCHCLGCRLLKYSFAGSNVT